MRNPARQSFRGGRGADAGEEARSPFQTTRAMTGGTSLTPRASPSEADVANHEREQNRPSLNQFDFEGLRDKATRLLDGAPIAKVGQQTLDEHAIRFGFGKLARQ